MIATLPMYDWPGLRAETDAFWAGTARRLAARSIASPETLTRPGEAGAEVVALWRHPDLLLAQTCGMPYVSGACGGARVVARPDYGLAEARDGLYHSVIVARADAGVSAVSALAGTRAAVNEWGSYSGHIALRAHLAALREGDAGASLGPFFAAVLISGSHAESARMVARGAADAAALDGVAWALLAVHEPATAARLAVVGRTAPAPALPFVTAPRFAAHAAALAAALDEAAAAAPRVPGLPRRVAPAGDADYAPIRAAARRAAREPFAPGAPAVPGV